MRCTAGNFYVFLFFLSNHKMKMAERVLSFLFGFREKFFCTAWANSMREFNIDPFCHIGFDLIPVAHVITDFFTVCTNRQQSAQRFYFRQCMLQIMIQLFEFNIFMLSVHCFSEPHFDRSKAEDR